MAEKTSLGGALKHSKFSGGKELAAKSPPVDDIDELIERISKETSVPPETVHKIIAMAHPSTVQFVLKQLHDVPELKNALSSKMTTAAIVAV